MLQGLNRHPLWRLCYQCRFDPPLLDTERPERTTASGTLQGLASANTVRERGERARKDTAMRIAQVAPLYESVPPKTYGGTERVVSWLTEELVRLGHHVTLFASADSMTTARLVPCCAESLRLSTDCVDQLAHHFVQLEEIGRAHV